MPWDRLAAPTMPQPCVNDPAVGKKLWAWMEARVIGREAYTEALRAIEKSILLARATN